MAGWTGSYFPATSPQDLAEAIEAIGSAVGTCTFTLSRCRS
jgi:hypothetical protein